MNKEDWRTLLGVTAAIIMLLGGSFAFLDIASGTLADDRSEEEYQRDFQQGMWTDVACERRTVDGLECLVCTWHGYQNTAMSMSCDWSYENEVRIEQETEIQ